MPYFAILTTNISNSFLCNITDDFIIRYIFKSNSKCALLSIIIISNKVILLYCFQLFFLNLYEKYFSSLLHILSSFLFLSSSIRFSFSLPIRLLYPLLPSWIRYRYMLLFPDFLLFGFI